MRALKQFMTKIPLLIRAVSLYVIAGALLYGGGTIVAAYTPDPQPVAQIVTAPKIKILSQQVISGHPVSFSVEKLDIKLPVKDGTYDPQTDQWTLTNDAVFFAAMTTEPNDTQGNTFIYGHNQPQVIEPMKDIAVGDIVTIKTSNGHTFRYEYVRDTIIAPTFTDVLNEDPEKPQLTVMTCEGIWSETRRLMYFDFVEVV
jgi:LPXTG-site transpeptidase (sortase) family protein